MAGTLRVGRAMLAALFLGAGSVGLASGFVDLGFVPTTIGPVSGALLFEILGGVFLLTGIMLAFRSIQKPLGPQAAVPAHIAFSQRQVQPLVIPPKAAPRAPKAKGPAGLVEIDDKIREVTKKINRAGVLLATGKLSSEGYTKYVEELKRQRGQLERERVTRELRGGAST